MKYTRLNLYRIIIIIIVACSCVKRTDENSLTDIDDNLYLKNIPNQPDSPIQQFIEDGKSPLWTDHNWGKSVSGHHQANLSDGIKFIAVFPDPDGRLETAYEDLNSFLAAGKINTESGNYIIETVMVSDLEGEAFRLDVQPNRCRIMAGDVEGIRRGIFQLEDEMLKIRGPFLPIGTIEHHPIIKRRISRCFYAPIKRPGNIKPMGDKFYGDELLDTIDYYPDQYLNHLAHEGVNGLWITVSGKDRRGGSIGFGDLVSTSITPNMGIDGEKRLAKLKKVVEKCAGYGIKVYIFTMEPHVKFEINDPVLLQYPDIVNPNNRMLCASSKMGQKYLYEAVNKIFTKVPELGGIINISHGELYTTCLSGLNSVGDGSITCPRCSKLEPWKILHNSLTAMEKGMHDAAPHAELISWLYMPKPTFQTKYSRNNLSDWVYDIAAHTPKNVILQFNLESGIMKTVFGKELIGGDYWTSVYGPSPRFERIAEIARQSGTHISAKIQTGTWLEAGTVPYVPVPSMLYSKFKAMKRLGVSYTMLNWLIGAAPGMMNKAAGMLYFDPFPDEETFLNELALFYWRKEDAPKVVKAWKHFSSAYNNYPLVNLFQFYGPVNDGVVWPLHLKPKDAILSPTYQLGDRETLTPWPPSGDRIGECFTEMLTLGEVAELCHRMYTEWDQGLEILNKLEPKYNNEADRIMDISVAKALGIQFHSAYNILHFYDLREKMLRMENRARLDVLEQLRHIIIDELDMNEKMISLCKNDPRLGFNSDAEGYKYFPEKIKWRMKQLQYVLENDLPEFEKYIRNNKLLYPEYTGKEPDGLVLNAIRSDGSLYPIPELDTINNHYDWHFFNQNLGEHSIRLSTSYDSTALYVIVLDDSTYTENISVNSSYSCPFSNMNIKIEPHRLYPCKHFNYDLKAKNRSHGVRVIRTEEYGFWYAIIRIPFIEIGLNEDSLHPIRIDVKLQLKGEKIYSCREYNPLRHRLNLGTDNPKDLSWLIFKE